MLRGELENSNCNHRNLGGLGMDGDGNMRDQVGEGWRGTVLRDDWKGGAFWGTR